MTAAGGRAVRRMQGQFKVDPKAVEAMQGVDSEHLLRILVDPGEPTEPGQGAQPLAPLQDYGLGQSSSSTTW